MTPAPIRTEVTHLLSLVYDYDVCDRPDACKGCLQPRHLKSECRRLTLERMNKRMQPMLFGEVSA